MIIIYFYFVFQFYALRCYSTVTRGSSSYPVTPRLTCSTKNWQQPGVLNVLNPGCSALHLYEKTKILKSLRSKVKHHGPMDSVSAQPCTLARLSENFSPLWCPCVVSNVIKKTVFHWLNHHFNRWRLWKWLKEVFTVDTIALSTTFAKGTQSSVRSLNLLS